MYIHLAGLPGFASRAKAVEVVYAATAIFVGVGEYEYALIRCAGCHVPHLLELLGHLVTFAVQGVETCAKQVVDPLANAWLAHALLL